MTLKGGATSACTACKYQRRKCIPECLLAPYFPADQTKHAEAMRSIKYQANLEMCRQLQQVSSMADDVISQLELGMTPPTNALPLFNQSYSMYKDSPKENNSLWIQHLFLDTNNHCNDSPVAIQSQLLDAQDEVVRDYDKIRPFIGDGQSYTDSKDNYDSTG
ncbi:hypothetical protein F3Y22_tig00111837pilonHSYRG00296 [Hibiscus syriacus]|uniref:LOB domain-containing protein n=1 Tax=Hibiscus syriacus TaxID=106335 RepID=A0A6A2XRR6_HIBSY|nr:hypothetical protein F3Y22_tig00111837pilonHSYRG00296 [Hibiscus syriacus]